MWKININQKVLGNLLRKLRNLYMNGTVTCRNFKLSSRNRKFEAIFASPNRYFTENSCSVLLTVTPLRPDEIFRQAFLGSLRNLASILLLTWINMTNFLNTLCHMACFCLKTVKIFQRKWGKQNQVIQSLLYLFIYHYFFSRLLSRTLIDHFTGAPNENIVQNHLKIALLNVF